MSFAILRGTLYEVADVSGRVGSHSRAAEEEYELRLQADQFSLEKCTSCREESVTAEMPAKYVDFGANEQFTW